MLPAMPTAARRILTTAAATLTLALAVAAPASARPGEPDKFDSGIRSTVVTSSLFAGQTARSCVYRSTVFTLAGEYRCN